MAIDKAVDSVVLDSYFSGIASAIREKNGEQSQYTPAQMAEAILSLPSGGDTSVVFGETSGGNTTIETGLSTVDMFVIYRSATNLGSGLAVAVIDYVNSYNISLGEYASTFYDYNSISGVSKDGGTIFWNATQNRQKLNTGIYSYIAIGKM